MTEQNLLRGKEVFLQRCVGCHGMNGDGKGPGASFLSPPPADFTDADDACCGGDTGPGDFYYRILRGWPGTAMENFGDRLSVDDIWRVVLFLKTIPNHTLDPNVVPEPKDYIVWKPSKELLAWLKSQQTLDRQRVFRRRSRSPIRSWRRRCASSRASLRVTSSSLNDGKTPLSLEDAAAGIKSIYQDLLDRAWDEARHAATSCRRVAEGNPADRSGPAMRRGLGTSPPPSCSRLALPAAAFAHEAARERPVALGDGRLDAGDLLRLRGLRARRVPLGLEGGALPRPRAASGHPALRFEEEDYYTPEWAFDEEEWDE